MRGGRCATRHPTRDRSTFKRRSSSSPGPASRLLQPAGLVTEASSTPLLAIRCFLFGACHRVLAPRITTSTIASHPCHCRHGLREKFPDVLPRCRVLKCTRPQQISGLLTVCIHISRFVRIAISYINPAEHPSLCTWEPNSITSVIQELQVLQTLISTNRLTQTPYNHDANRGSIAAKAHTICITALSACFQYRLTKVNVCPERY